MELKPLAAGLGAAALAGAVLALAGRIDASLIAIVVLAVAVRAAAAGLDRDPGALAVIGAASFPLVAFALVATVRSGAPSLEAVAGANRVAGPAIVAGPVLLVVASLFAVAAAVLACGTMPIRSEGIAGRLDLCGTGVLVVAIVAGAIGPQIERASDLVPWTLGALVVAGLVGEASRREWPPRLRAIPNALGMLALGIAAFGGRL